MNLWVSSLAGRQLADGDGRWGTVPAWASAIAAALSLIVAIAVALQARASRERDADLALLTLYEAVTAPQVRRARSAIWEWRQGAEPRPRVSTMHSSYFELLWVIEQVYESLQANGIRPVDAERVLGFHLGQIQQHIAAIHRAQVREAAPVRLLNQKKLNNSASTMRYCELRARFDGPGARFSCLRVTGPDSDARDDLVDPVLNVKSAAVCAIERDIESRRIADLIRRYGRIAVVSLSAFFGVAGIVGDRTISYFLVWGFVSTLMAIAVEAQAWWSATLMRKPEY